jgi:hypothetical protein
MEGFGRSMNEQKGYSESFGSPDVLLKGFGLERNEHVGEQGE